MRNFLKLAVAIGASVLLAGCAGGGGFADSNTKPLSIRVNTAGIKCTRLSPEIHVTGTPEGTTKYYFHLNDLNAPGWNHGGGTTPAKADGVIPSGAIRGGYNGPCPPGGSHSYVFSVQALDDAGNVLAQGKQTIDM